MTNQQFRRVNGSLKESVSHKLEALQTNSKELHTWADKAIQDAILDSPADQKEFLLAIQQVLQKF